jgi:oligosaccharyltransferase complex subunit alpha (ribophorin I)
MMNRNVKYHTSIPTSSITEADVLLQKTYLDTLGRTVLVIKARNLVDDFRDREVIVTYDYSLIAALRKPLVVFASMVGVFASAWIIGGVDMKFTRKA